MNTRREKNSIFNDYNVTLSAKREPYEIETRVTDYWPMDNSKYHQFNTFFHNEK